MGKILSGILGPVSGRIGGVVGGRWKSTPYLRSYVIPGASRTDLQSDQRDRFAYMVAAAKPFVGRVFNPYYDKFLSRESGFNRCIAANIPTTPDMPPVDLLEVTDGPLYPSSITSCNISTNNAAVILVWSTDLGVDGKDTDVAVGWLRDPATNKVVFGADVTRVTGTMVVHNSIGLVSPAVCEAGVFFIKLKDLLVVKISKNLVSACTWVA
jgi:hypothetical protein